jgi:hypothetical protein
MKKSKSCEVCKFWKVGDPSIKDVGNVGLCVWTMPRKSGFYHHTKHAPFWTENIAYRTVSWNGSDCGAFRRKT